MLSEDLLIPGIMFCLGGSALLRIVLWLYYSDGERILPLLRLAPRSDVAIQYYKRFDTLLAPAPFMHCWLEIGAALLFFRWTGYNGFAGLLLACVAAGRMRALQETGHNALHSALCPSKRFQWFLSNTLFQFPTFKRDMASRFISHVKEHHPNADIPGRDPNLRRVTKSGMVPGVTTVQFVRALIHPITPRGLFETISGNLRDSCKENNGLPVILHRIAGTVAFISLYIWLGGWQGWLVGHVLPAFAVYPLFAWWSLLSKHRWHTKYDAALDRKDHDFEHGRATDFSGLTGAVQRYLFFPMSDAYHLAHHIYPYVRSEYMPVVDRQLKIQEPRYTKYISCGMLFGSHGQPAALSELYHRLVARPEAFAIEPT
jgi:fatty acid desaturase